MPLVDEFYIIAESGLCYYSKSRKKEVDQTLFSGLLTALNTLSAEIASRNIDCLVLQNQKYVISKVEQLMFIVQTGVKTKDTDIRKELNEMEMIFFQYFSAKELAQSWDGDLKVFRILDTKYDKYFVEAATNRMASLF